MDLPANAPVIAASEVEVAAEPETVWLVLADINRWPEWNPEVRRAALEGELSPGARFRWKAAAAKITSTVETVERPTLIAWSGRTVGVRAVHRHTLAAAPGGTAVSSEESWSGPLPRLLPGTMRKQLQRAVDDGLRHLKAEAERRASR